MALFLILLGIALYALGYATVETMLPNDTNKRSPEIILVKILSWIGVIVLLTLSFFHPKFKSWKEEAVIGIVIIFTMISTYVWLLSVTLKT